MKPQNVLVEQKADGRLRPVVMDFGLARDVRSRLNLTEVGCSAGHAEYMSPEQARGNSGDQRIDARTDVYSLGAMLYELLCGQPHLKEVPRCRVLISVINDEVVPIRARNHCHPRSVGCDRHELPQQRARRQISSGASTGRRSGFASWLVSRSPAAFAVSVAPRFAATGHDPDPASQPAASDRSGAYTSGWARCWPKACWLLWR